MSSRDIELTIKALNETQRQLDQVIGGLRDVGDAADNVGQRSKNASSGVSSLFGSLAQGAGMAVGFKALDLALSGVGAAMDFTTNAAIGMNSQLTSASKAFTTMLGSAQEADRFIRKLADFAARTPFEFGGLVTAAQRMLAIGFAADEIIPILTATGDAVAAIGGSSEMVDRVTVALGQMQAKTKVSAEEMMQLTEAGIPAWQLLADHIGKTVAETQKLASEGKVSADQFIAAFQEFSNMNFGGMMESQSRTLSGALSNLTDSLSMMIANGAKPAFDALTDLALKAEEFASSSEFQAWAADAAVKFEAVTNAVVGSSEALAGQWIPAMQDAGTIASNSIQVLDNLNEAFLGVEGSTISSASSIYKWTTIFGPLSFALDQGAQVSRGYLEIAQAVNHTLNAQNSDLQDLAPEWRRYVELVREGKQAEADALAERIAFNESIGRKTASLGAEAQITGVLIGHMDELAVAEAQAATNAEQHAAAADAVTEAEQRTAERIQATTDAQDAHMILFGQVGNVMEETAARLEQYARANDDVAVSVDGVTVAIQSQADANTAANAIVDNAASAINHWNNELDEIAQAIAYNDELLANGTITVEEHARNTEILTGAEQRRKDGINNDLIPAFVDSVVLQEQLQGQLENLKIAYDNGEISAEEYARGTAELNGQIQNAAAEGGPFGLLIQKLNELIGALLEADSTDPEITATGDFSHAWEQLENFRAAVRAGSIFPVSIVTGDASGGGNYADGGTVPESGIAMVGERGPELVFLPKGAHVLSNENSRRYLGGFAEGTTRDLPPIPRGGRGDRAGVPNPVRVGRGDRITPGVESININDRPRVVNPGSRGGSSPSVIRPGSSGRGGTVSTGDFFDAGADIGASIVEGIIEAFRVNASAIGAAIGEAIRDAATIGIGEAIPPVKISVDEVIREGILRPITESRGGIRDEVTVSVIQEGILRPITEARGGIQETTADSVIREGVVPGIQENEQVVQDVFTATVVNAIQNSAPAIQGAAQATTANAVQAGVAAAGGGSGGGGSLQPNIGSASGLSGSGGAVSTSGGGSAPSVGGNQGLYTGQYTPASTSSSALPTSATVSSAGVTDLQGNPIPIDNSKSILDYNGMGEFVGYDTTNNPGWDQLTGLTGVGQIPNTRSYMMAHQGWDVVKHPDYNKGLNMVGLVPRGELEGKYTGMTVPDLFTGENEPVVEINGQWVIASGTHMGQVVVPWQQTDLNPDLDPFWDADIYGDPNNPHNKVHPPGDPMNELFFNMKYGHDLRNNPASYGVGLDDAPPMGSLSEIPGDLIRLKNAYGWSQFDEDFKNSKWTGEGFKVQAVGPEMLDDDEALQKAQADTRNAFAIARSASRMGRTMTLYIGVDRRTTPSALGGFYLKGGAVDPFAKGGVTTQPTLGLLSEFGQREGVVPLEGRGAEEVADALVRAIERLGSRWSGDHGQRGHRERPHFTLRIGRHEFRDLILEELDDEYERKIA